LRDLPHMIRAFAARASSAAALCAALLFALHATAPASHAQTKAAGDSQRAAKESGAPPPPVVDTMPWQEFIRKYKELFEQGRLGADTRLDATAAGERQDDGSLNPETVVFTWTTASDETAASLAQMFVATLSRSRLLRALEGAKEVSLRLRLDETNAFLSVTASMASEERARMFASGYGAMLRVAAESKKGTWEEKLYRSVGFASDGKLFTFTFEMPKGELSDIIADVTAKSAAAGRPNN
jgi:hypothetical protein